MGFDLPFGHTIAKPLAALAPIYFSRRPPEHWIGVSLRGVQLIVASGDKRSTRTDDVLITHQGISGPACLSISRDAAAWHESERVRVEVNFFPAHTGETLDALFVSLQTERAAQFIRTFFHEQFPDAVMNDMLHAAGISADQKWNSLSKTLRRTLVQTAQAFRLGDISDVPIERGEVSAGGVALNEVYPKTMRSRLKDGLYIAGETLDVAGEVGGFNLQAAYSTGWLAGADIAACWIQQQGKNFPLP
jgi:predicted Rossmann fold flavoprotein